MTELYGQEIEVALLGALRPHLSGGAFVDVGAERGGIARALLAHGYGPAHLIEPAPDSAAALRESLAGRPDVRVLELAAGADDGESTLYLASDPDGRPMPAFNKTGSPGPDALGWRPAHTVPRRSLASLVAGGSIPDEVALVKVDAEGADRDVVEGMGALGCEALMVEHWVDMPDTVGDSPWTLGSLRELLEPRGLSRQVSVRHRGPEVRVIQGGAEMVAGDYGNLIFLTEDLHGRSAEAISLVAALADTLSDLRVELERHRAN